MDLHEKLNMTFNLFNGSEQSVSFQFAKFQLPVRSGLGIWLRLGSGIGLWIGIIGLGLKFSEWKFGTLDWNRTVKCTSVYLLYKISTINGRAQF